MRINGANCVDHRREIRHPDGITMAEASIQTSSEDRIGHRVIAIEIVLVHQFVVNMI